MKDSTRQRQLDDVDAGMPPREVLARTTALEEAALAEAVAQLSSTSDDSNILSTFGLDMTAMRKPIRMSDGDWLLP